MELTVREMTTSDIALVVDYFNNSDANFLLGMGAKKNMLPPRKEWIESITLELNKPYNQKKVYYIIWVLNGAPVGHSNVSDIIYGKTASMHLHMWLANHRESGFGLQFILKSIPFYFKNLKLQKLICQPYSKNNAPNKTLKKIGFQFTNAYQTVPGPISFLQTVNNYELSRTKYDELYISARESINKTHG